MILILISWIYILATIVNLGLFFEKKLNIEKLNFVLTCFLGLFATTFLATIWAIFGRINYEFHIALLLLNCILVFNNKTDCKTAYFTFFKELKYLIFPLKIILLLISLLILAQCATKPYVIDNESYYIQTIKWINEYGFVNGLANLHIFFGQTSGWHVLQSAFNFSFIYKNFNDLSGFCLLLGNTFAIIKLNYFFKNKEKNYLIIGLIPLANLFFFQLISAPSPDIPVYILTFILFYYFIKKYNYTNVKIFNLITIMVLFILYIKPTSLALTLIPLLLLIQNFKKLFPKLLPVTLISTCILLLFIVKNTIITGFAFYPTTHFDFFKMDYAVPKFIINYYFEETRLDGFYLTKQQFQSFSYYEIAIKWFFSSKIDSIFNFLTIIITIITPYFIYKFYNKKSVWILYLITIIQLIIMLLTSPQFRYYIHYIFFFCFFIFASFIYTNKKYTFFILYLSVLLVSFILFTPLNLSVLTKNKLIANNSNFSIKNVIFPHSNSKVTTKFQSVQIGNLKYNSPLNNEFFWGNGDGKLPCVNQDQLNYFEKYLHVIPQMRTTDLKDGFYAKKLSPNE